MKKILITFIISLAVTGCMAPKFSVKQADTRFSENKNPLHISENNRISTKSIAGGIHINEKGVFINPFVSKDPSNNQVKILGLKIVNKTSYDTVMGGVNQLGVIKEVVFRFPNGELITLNVSDQDNRSSDTISYNSIAKYASYDKWETGAIRIAPSQLQKLASATKFSCKITGTKQSVVYEEKDISPKFISNLKSFYDSYVK